MPAAADLDTVAVNARSSGRRERFARPRWYAVWLLMAFLFVLYNSNLHYLYTGDTIPARVLPFALLVDGHLYVDDWVTPFLRPYVSGKIKEGTYFLMPSRGHLMSAYPIATPLVVTPLYIAPAWWVAQHRTLPTESFIFIAQAMDKLSAAVLAALAVGLFYVALRRVLSSRSALLLALVLGVASNTWAIASQALWTTALSEIAYALFLWAVLALYQEPEKARRYVFWAGFALALAVANKITNVLIALPLAAYFLWHHRRHAWAFVAAPVAIGALLLSYNIYYFGTPLGAYAAGFRTIGYTSVADGFRGNFFNGLAGLLVSPNRGLFIYMPWMVLAVWGAIRLWREKQFGPYLIVGIIAVIFFYAKLERWYGGYCWGPRYLADLLPLYVFFLLPVWPQITRVRLLKLGFAATLAVAVSIQVLGAYFVNDWDATPVSVDAHPERVWDWSDTQIGRALRSGPSHTRLTDHLGRLLHPRAR